MYGGGGGKMRKEERAARSSVVHGTGMRGGGGKTRKRVPVVQNTGMGGERKEDADTSTVLVSRCLRCHERKKDEETNIPRLLSWVPCVGGRLEEKKTRPGMGRKSTILISLT